MAWSWLGRLKYTSGDTSKRVMADQTDVVQSTFYHRFFKRGNLPDPGAQVYGYDTLQLLPMYPINEFNMVKSPPLIAAPGMQVYSRPGVLIYELPQPNGQLFMQPLFDPNAEPG